MDELQNLEHGGLPDLRQRSEHLLHQLGGNAGNAEARGAPNPAPGPPQALDDSRPASFS